MEPTEKRKRGRPRKTELPETQALPLTKQADLFLPPELAECLDAVEIIALMSKLNETGVKILKERIITAAIVTQRHFMDYPKECREQYNEFSKLVLKHFKK